MTSSVQSSPSQLFPNLGSVITTDDVSQKGTGSYKADYVNWCRTSHLLHTHAPGWQFHLACYTDGNHVWKAPNNTAYVVGYFTGPNGERTPDFPQAVMDNRNNAIAYDKVSARDLTDSHRRCLCSSAAAQFGLAWQLWAREEVENPHREATQAAKPATKIEGVADDDQPLKPGDRDECLGLISELKFDPETKKPTPEKLESFLKAFRRDFGLGKTESVAPAFTSVKHQTWLQVNLPKYV